MARAWLRGVEPQNDANDSSDDWSLTAREHNSILYHFLTKCLNFVHVDEQVAGGKSFDGNEQASDTDGSFGGSDYQFVISSGKFSSGMVGEFIVIKDPTNEENSGIYLIDSYIDSNNITINFLTTAGTYPTAGSGLSWWVLDRSNMPALHDDYAVIESPHATSKCTIQLYYVSHSLPSGGDFGGRSSNGAGLAMRVVAGPASENWDSGSHAWTTLAQNTRWAERKFKVGRGRVDDVDHNRIFGFGHDDGSFFLLYSKHDAGAGELQGVMCGVVEPFETDPTHDVKDLIVTSGPSHVVAYNNALTRDSGVNAMDRGEAWSSADYNSHECVWSDWHANSDRLFGKDFTGPNEYTGEYDGFPIFVRVDPNDNEGAFSLLGQHDPANVCFTTARHLGELQTYDSDQWMHLAMGVAFPWPGLPTYF